MQNLLDNIIEKNASKNDIDLDLIKKILDIQLENESSDSRAKKNRFNSLKAFLKGNL